MCVAELASMLAGERFSDHPSCACPALTAFLRACNDHLGRRSQAVHEDVLAGLRGILAGVPHLPPEVPLPEGDDRDTVAGNPPRLEEPWSVVLASAR